MRVQGLGLRVWGLGFIIEGLGFGFKVQGSGSRGLGFRVRMAGLLAPDRTGSLRTLGQNHHFLLSFLLRRISPV